MTKTNSDLKTAARRTARRRRFLRETLDRHPVSLTRQRLGTALLVLIILGLGAYYVTTQDAAIRRRAIAYLREVTGGEVSVGEANFAMFGGITLKDVRVAVPFNQRLDPSAVDRASREIFSARSLTLVHNPWRLLFGGFRVDRIIAAHPTITLVHNVDTEMRNWRMLLGRKDMTDPVDPGERPDITVRNAIVEIVSVDGEGRHEVKRVVLDADVRPHRQIDTAYCIDVRRLSAPAERTTVIISPDDHLLTGAPFVNVRTIGLQLPKLYQRFFRRIALDGEVKVNRVTYDMDARQRDDEVEVRNVRCLIPLSMIRSGTSSLADMDLEGASPDKCVAMTDINGKMRLSGTRLHVDITGIVNGSNCMFSGWFDHIDKDPAQMGIDLRIRSEMLPMPLDALRQEILADERMPAGLRGFLHDYDPIGQFDIEGRVVRAADSPRGPSFVGTLRPRGAEASYHSFPFRIRGLQGQIRFEEEAVFIEHLRGRHGTGTVTINGVIDRSTDWASIDLNIDATTLPLDIELRNALSDRYQAIWASFNPRGTAHINVKLQRPGGRRSDPRPEWRTTVTADLADGRVMFEHFPYPLDGVYGQIRLDKSRIRFNGLTGRNGKASVRIDGYASMRADRPPDVELRVEARSLPLDDALANALPPDGRGALAQFQPEGFVDLLGTVSFHDTNEGVVYDLRANLYDAKIRYEAMPYLVENVRGRLHIRPDNFTMIEVHGNHGSANVTGRGEVRRTPDGIVAELAFDCIDLALDDELYQTLPRRVQALWDRIKPTGAVHFKTDVRYTVRHGESSIRHRTGIEVFDAELKLAGFPLPITSVNARAFVTDRRVEIVSFNGRVGDGKLSLSGSINLDPPGRRGVFEIDATGFEFNDELLAAAPKGLRNILETARPQGRFSVRLDSLLFDTDDRDATQWDFAGRVDVEDASATLGVDLKQMTGGISGHGSVRRDGSFTIDAGAEFERITISHWLLENARARIEAPADSRTVTIADASGDLYGGKASGLAEIEFREGFANYRLSVTARDVQLGRYLSTAIKTPPAKEPPKPAHGYVYGNVYVTGRTGPTGYLYGGGEVFVREAQVWKLPLVWMIFQVLNLAPDENVFHDGWLKFFLTQDTLTLHKIDLQGNAMSFVGGGTLDLRDKRLDVTLLAGSPVRIRVPFLTDILEGAARELMEIRVRGTLSKPEITPTPLKSLHKALEALFPEPPDRPDPKSSPVPRG
ncbi:MAG: AsmA-like C-terminal domain-containing protein [Planctomycetota bacterium]|nr:AsmA-like C-terminal domain-containing protein [Planctomycetota bacterium]